MNVRSTGSSILTLVAVAAVTVACGGPQPTSTSAPPSATATASEGSSPTADAGTSEPPASVLEGTWMTPETTCEAQNAALAAAGFSSADLELGDWDAATCGGMMHGSQFTIRFVNGRLVVFQDGAIGWDGQFRIVDAGSFEAGERGAFYITYTYALNGDELNIDVTRDDYPTSSEAELLGERIAQTVIYETAPFVREP
jgi:hypothetical protein